MSDFDSLTLALEGWFAASMCDLPDSLRQRVEHEFTPMPWDQISADQLFPATLVELGEARQFEAVGLARKHWSTASPIRTNFRGAFEAAGLPYFNQHSFRTTLVQLGQTLCRDAEQYKACSQNMGHEGVLTTVLNYGAVAPRRQGQIIQTLAIGAAAPSGQAEVVAQAVVQAMRDAGLLGGQG